MRTLFDALQQIGVGSLELFWLPLAAWTVLAGAILPILRMMRNAHPLLLYRAHLALFFALPIGLLLVLAVEIALRFVGQHAVPESTIVYLIALPPTTAPLQSAFTLYHLLGLIFLAFGVVACGRLGWLGLNVLRLTRFRRRPRTEGDAGIQEESDRLARALGIRRRVRVLISAGDEVPLTFGWRQPHVVLPQNVVGDAAARRMVLMHELIHVRRHDYALHWAEQLTCGLFFAHPMVTFLGRHLQVRREMACDAEVLRREAVAPRAYADLLYRLLPISSSVHPVGMRMADVRNIKERILAMTRFGRFTRTRAPRLAAGGLGLLILAAGAWVAVNADTLAQPKIDEPAGERTEQEAATETFVIVEQMPELIGGLASIQENLRYPESARDAGIEGRVFLQFTVNKQGDVEDAGVVRGLQEDLDEAALQALRQAKFVPGRQAGEVVPVKMSIPITFRLPGESGVRETEPTDVSQRPIIEIAHENGSVAGWIRRHTGEGIPGVNVTIPGTTLGAATDMEGHFVIHGVDDEASSIRIDLSGFGLETVETRLSELKKAPAQSGFRLVGSYPNPFNPVATIRFELPAEADVTLEVFDVAGRRVHQERAGLLSAGSHDLLFDGSNLPSGAYFYRVTAATADRTETQAGRFNLVK